MRTVPQWLAAQSMVCDEDKKHMVDVKPTAASRLGFQSISSIPDVRFIFAHLKIILDCLHSSVVEIQW